MALAGWMLTNAAVRAEEAFPALAPEVVRAAYEKAKTDWPADAFPMADVIVAGVDEQFRDRPPGRSVLTREVVAIYQPDLRRAPVALNFAIARALTRDEIIDWWAHGVFLGQGCYGIPDAAGAYLGLGPGEMVTADVAALVALSPAPGRLAGQPEVLAKRRDAILRILAENGALTAAQLEANLARPLRLRDPLGTCPPR